MLKKAKGNMYGFITHTWNPVKGICPHNCSYCYMRKWWPQMKAPRLVEQELKTDLGSGNRIFVGSGIDLFAKEIPSEWIVKVLEHCNKYPGNEYLFQTKNTRGMYFFKKRFTENHILCTTLETNRGDGNIAPSERAFWLSRPSLSRHRKMITIEPIMDFDLELFVEMILKINPYQVNIGADSVGNYLPEPPKDKILKLIAALESEAIKVHLKPNLRRLIK